MRCSLVLLLFSVLFGLYALMATTISLPEHVAPGHTGSPIEGGRTCATAGCHLAGGTGTGGPDTPFRIETSLDSYTPGVPVEITILMDEPGQTYYRPGFQVTVVRGGVHAGSLTLVDQAKTAYSGPANSPNQNYVNHRAPDANTRQWTVSWQPDDGDGEVRIYAAGLSRFAGRVYSHNVTLPRGAPSAPSLVSPPNNATGVSTSPTLSWNASSGAAAYHLQVSAQANFASTVVDRDDVTTTTHQADGLEPGTQYHWRVRAGSGGVWSEWSSTRNFTTQVAAPSAPTPASPAHNATGVSTTPTLSWNAASGADVYHLQVSVQANFASTVFDVDDITATSHQVDGLQPGTQYHWRLRAGNHGGWSDWSSIRSFTTQVAAPAAPVPASPADAATGVPTSPMLSWNAASGAEEYQLQVSTESDFASTVFDKDDITGTSHAVEDLNHDTQYFWRVRAGNAGGWSDWSAVRRFTTEGSGVGTQPEGPEVTAVSLGAYPNPFSDRTTIIFTLPSAGDAGIVVFDMAGREVAVVARGWYPAGEHRIVYDGADLLSGTYIVRLRSNGTTESIRLMRVR